MPRYFIPEPPLSTLRDYVYGSLQEFYQPIITPFELEIALGAGRSWTGEYILDFDRILRESKENSEERSDVVKEERDEDRPEFSLITGKYRQAKRYGDASTDSEPASAQTSSDLVLRQQEDSLIALPNSAASESSEFLIECHSNGVQCNSLTSGPIAAWRLDQEKMHQECWNREEVALRGGIKLTKVSK